MSNSSKKEEEQDATGERKITASEMIDDTVKALTDLPSITATVLGKWAMSTYLKYEGREEPELFPMDKKDVGPTFDSIISRTNAAKWDLGPRDVLRRWSQDRVIYWDNSFWKDGVLHEMLPTPICIKGERSYGVMFNCMKCGSKEGAESLTTCLGYKVRLCLPCWNAMDDFCRAEHDAFSTAYWMLQGALQGGKIDLAGDYARSMHEAQRLLRVKAEEFLGPKPFTAGGYLEDLKREEEEREAKYKRSEPVYGYDSVRSVPAPAKDPVPSAQPISESK